MHCKNKHPKELEADVVHTSMTSAPKRARWPSTNSVRTAVRAADSACVADVAPSASTASRLLAGACAVLHKVSKKEACRFKAESSTLGMAIRLLTGASTHKHSQPVAITPLLNCPLWHCCESDVMIEPQPTMKIDRTETH